MISYKDNIERCLCGGLKVNGKCTRCERNKEAEKNIEDIEKIVNLRGDYEEVDIDYIDCNGEMLKVKIYSLWCKKINIYYFGLK